MMTFIFYITTQQTRHEDYQRIYLPDGRVAYVRVVDAGNVDLVEALARATPRPGEMLMNTHRL